MNETPTPKPKTTEGRKKQARTLLIVLAVLFAVLLVLNLLSDSSVLSKLLPHKGGDDGEREPVFLFNPDYELNIFEDEGYLNLNRLIRYQEGAITIYLVNENDYLAGGKPAVFFGEYFDAVIRGDHNRYNALLSKDFIEKNGTKDRFTMQQLYDIEIVKLNEFIEDEGTPQQITVTEFRVSYRIRRNNGTFRDDLESGAARPQIYQLICTDRTGEIKLQSVSEYNR